MVGLRDGHYDVALLVTDWLAEAQAANALEDLHHWQQLIPIHDWPAGWPRSLVQPLLFGQHLSSIPWHDGPECLVYRTDLFQDPTTRAAFRSQFSRDLAPPTTWEEFEQTARFFTDHSRVATAPSSPLSPTATTPSTTSPSSSGARGGELTDSTGRPCLTTPIAHSALEFYRRVVRDPALCHPRSPQLDSTQSGDLFLAGEVAMMANWFGFAARAGRQGSPLAGKVAIAPIPTANNAAPVSLSVFWALAMGRGSRHKELAWQFLRFVASRNAISASLATAQSAAVSPPGAIPNSRPASPSTARSKPSLLARANCLPGWPWPLSPRSSTTSSRELLPPTNPPPLFLIQHSARSTAKEFCFS